MELNTVKYLIINRDYIVEKFMGAVLHSFGLVILKCLPSVFNQYLFLSHLNVIPNLETKSYEIYSKFDQKEN